MKIIDSNGKLFKKFNIIDVIVVLLVLAVIAAVCWKTVSAGVNAAEEKKTEAEQAYDHSDHLIFQVVCPGIPQAVADGFQSAMTDHQVMNNGVPVEAYIIDCTSEPGEDGLYTVFFTIEASLVEKEGIYSVGTQEIRVGKPYIVKTYQIETSGSIYSMEVKENG